MALDMLFRCSVHHSCVRAFRTLMSTMPKKGLVQTGSQDVFHERSGRMGLIELRIEEEHLAGMLYQHTSVLETEFGLFESPELGNRPIETVFFATEAMVTQRGP